MRFDSSTFDVVKQMLSNLLVSTFLGLFWGLVSFVIIGLNVITVIVTFVIILFLFPMLYCFQLRSEDDSCDFAEPN